MSTKNARIALVVAAVAAAAVVLLWLTRSGGADAVSASPNKEVGEAAAPGLQVPEERRPVDAAAGAAAEEPSHPLPPPTPPDAAAEGRAIQGVVLDLEGARQPFAEVLFQPRQLRGAETGHSPPPAPLQTVSDASGEFRLPVPSADGYLEARGAHFVTVLAPVVRRPADVDFVHRVLVTSSASVAGSVAGEGAGPLKDAVVEVRLPDGLFLKSAVADRLRGLEAAARTGEDGRFELPAFPLVSGAKLMAFARGYRPEQRAGPTAEGEEIRFELSRLPQGDAVCGIVVDARGVPAPDALVSVGGRAVKSGADGVFCMDLDDGFARRLSRTEPIEIVAIRGEMRSERVTLPSFSEGLVKAWPTPLVLRLELPRLALSGRVVDAYGEGVPGLEVSVADPTPFGYEEMMPGSDMLMRQTVELASGAVGIATTNREGAFVLNGLEPRDYVIEAVEPGSLASVHTEPLPAGTAGVVIEYAPEMMMITGRVTNYLGEPIPDVRLAVTRESEMRGLLIGHTAFTDRDGRFGLGPVSGKETLLRIEGDAIMPLLRYPLSEADYREANLVLARRCNVRVDWSTVDRRADSVSILDATGARLEPMEWRADTVSVMPTIALRSEEVFCVPEDAAFAVTSREDGAEVQRVSLACVPGATQVIRF